jgi:predicted nucleic acid-binding protein
VSESWVINTSPTIVLAKAGLMDLVPRLVSRLVIPEPVALEIRHARRDDLAVRWLDGPGTAFIEPAVPELSSLSASQIGAGERAVISWAGSRAGFAAVLDDREARQIAAQLGVRVLGTVGLVLRLKKAGLIPAVRPRLLALRAAGAYIGEDLFAEAIRLAEEQP